MKYLFILGFVLSACQSNKDNSVSTENYKTLHDQAVLVDTHNDILMHAVEKGLMLDKDLAGQTHSDLTRLKEGGVDVQIFSVYTDGSLENSYAMAMREMDSLDAVVKRNPEKITKVGKAAEINLAVNTGKIAAMFGVEGGHMIEDDLQKLDTLYLRGARYLTLTHNVSPSWASSAADETTYPDLADKGLTPFGEEVIRHMNTLGMLIDVSHAGDETFWDVMKLTAKPIIASHSSVFALVPSRRNLKDEQIKAIAKNGGVIQVNFHPGFIDPSFDEKEAAFLSKHAAESDSLLIKGYDEWYMLNYLYKKYAAEGEKMRPPLSMLIDHIDYIVKLVGVDYVGLGSDFDGIVLTPLQLDDVTGLPNISKELLARGYDEIAIKKILGANFIRVLTANE